MSLSRTVSEINGDFSRKSQIFPPRVFCAIAEGVPLGIWYRRWGQNTNDGATALRKKFDDIFSRLDTMHHRYGRTPDDSKHRASLRIASRGNKAISCRKK